MLSTERDLIYFFVRLLKMCPLFDGTIFELLRLFESVRCRNLSNLPAASKDAF